MGDSLILEFAFSISKRIIPITLQLQYEKEKVDTFIPRASLQTIEEHPAALPVGSTFFLALPLAGGGHTPPEWATCQKS